MTLKLWALRKKWKCVRAHPQLKYDYHYGKFSDFSKVNLLKVALKTHTLSTADGILLPRHQWTTGFTDYYTNFAKSRVNSKEHVDNFEKWKACAEQHRPWIADVTDDEVTLAMGQLKTNMAGSFDGIVLEILLAAGNPAVQFLSKAFSGRLQNVAPFDTDDAGDETPANLVNKVTCPIQCMQFRALHAHPKIAALYDTANPALVINSVTVPETMSGCVFFLGSVILRSADDADLRDRTAA